MSNADEYIWAEILKRLPAKAVGRIRCVCKAWNSLISSSFFLSNHLSFLVHNNEPSPPICYLLFDPQLTWCKLINYSFYRPEELNAPTFSPLPFTIANNSFKWKPVDVVHGVVCIARENEYDKPFTTTAGSSILWNPTIGKHLSLPDAPSIGWAVIGFGFDARTNDFKVVRYLLDNAKTKRPSIYELFSTKRGCWQRLESDHILCGARYTPCCMSSPCFVNGSIYWIVRGCAVLLVFDCVKEELETMELPEALRNAFILRLIRWGEVLTVMAMGFVEGERMGLEIHEYSVSGSWKKLTLRPDCCFMTIDKDGLLFDKLDFRKVREEGYDLINRSVQPMNGRVFEPSLFLLDDSDAVDDNSDTYI